MNIDKELKEYMDAFSEYLLLCTQENTISQKKRAAREKLMLSKESLRQKEHQLLTM